MKIIIYVKEKQFETALCRGLAYYSSGINIISLEEYIKNTGDNETGYDSSVKADNVNFKDKIFNNALNYLKFDVLITDDSCTAGILPKKTLLFCYDGYEGDNEGSDIEPYKIYLMSPLSKIIRTSIHIYEKNEGRRFLEYGISEKTVIKIFSPFGGAGATSIALTLARLIKLRLEKNVIIITENIETNYLPYINVIRDRLRPSAEMDFLLETKKKTDILNYTVTDEYGVYILNTGKSIQNVIGEIEKTTDFDYVLIDSKDDKCIKDYYGYKDIIVVSLRDSRACECKDKGRIIIRNFAECSSISENENNVVCDIINDDDSFRRQGEKVNIKISSAFTLGVANVMKTIL